MKKYLIIFFITGLLNIVILANQIKLQKEIDKSNKKSEILWEKSEYAKSIILSKKIFKKAEALKYTYGKLVALIQIADCFYHRDENKNAIQYYKKALKLAKKNDNYFEKQAICNKGIGKCERLRGNNQISLKFLYNSLEKYTKLLDVKEIADIEYEIGGIYKDQGRTEKALKLFQRSLNSFESLDSDEKYGFIVQTLHAIGETLANGNQFNNAIKYFKRAETISKEQKKDDLYAESLSLLGWIYEKMNDSVKPEIYYKKAIKILLDIKDNFRIATAYNNLGEFYRKKNKFILAKNNYLKAIKLYRDFEYQWGISASLANLGAISIKLLDDKNALQYLREAEKIAEKQNIPDLKEFIYKNISKAYELGGNIKIALEYFKRYIKINNEILNKDRNTKFAEMQTKYETDKKDQEIKFSKLNLNRQNLISRLFIGGFAIAILVVFLLYSRYKIKKIANSKLSIINIDLNNAKQIIEQKNLNITDSIKYATRIQNAILPSRTEMNRSLKEYFVLYKPKDIVSGDFYWLYEDMNRMILAVIDCTGHGVPGALMSIMGNSLLNEIVSEKNIFFPDEILKELNKGIIRSLKKVDKESGINDGMDVCLFYIDKVNVKYLYSGARRPLFIVKKDNQELIEIKGIRLSIGEMRNKSNKVFTSEELDLNFGDMVYLTSDGFIDQSNLNGIKFGSKKLRILLSEISQKSLCTQERILKAELHNYQDAEEQRDDITIIGLRI